MVVTAYPGIVYQHAPQEEEAQQEQYAGYEQQSEEGHELQGISEIQNKGYDHHVPFQGKGYDYSEDHHIDYYVSTIRKPVTFIRTQFGKRVQM